MRATSIVLLSVLLVSAGSALAAAIPFDVSSGRPMVDLMVNGQGPYPFVLDTGSPSLLVMKSLADELKLEVVGSDELQSPVQGTPVKVDVVRVDSVALGDATIEGYEALVLDMGEHGLGRGIVGPAFFREHGTTTLDFDRNTISFGEGSGDEVRNWLPFGASAPLLDIPVRIGDLEVDGHLDTGNPGVLSFPNRLEDRLPLSGPAHTIGQARTVDAVFDIRAAPIDASARIGDAEVPLSQIMLSAIPVANLGTAGLRGLVLHIDWQNERFALIGRADPAPGPLHAAQAAESTDGAHRVVRDAGGEGPRFGLRAIPSGGGPIEVIGTEPDSAAEAIGLLAGDQIVAINGRPTGEVEPSAIRTELARSDLVLKVERDGEMLTLSR